METLELEKNIIVDFFKIRRFMVGGDEFKQIHIRVDEYAKKNNLDSIWTEYIIIKFQGLIIHDKVSAKLAKYNIINIDNIAKTIIVKYNETKSDFYLSLLEQSLSGKKLSEKQLSFLN